MEAWRLSSPRACDAEASVEFLCRKFELLSRQLRHEEGAREAAEHRAWALLDDVEGAEEFAAQRRSADEAAEARRRCMDGCELQEAAAQGERRCSHLAAEFRASASEGQRAQARLLDAADEVAQERHNQGELSRRLSAARAERCVQVEDLRVAEQRALLCLREHEVGESGLAAALASLRGHALPKSELLAQKLRERRGEARDGAGRAEALAEAIGTARGEAQRQSRAAAAADGEERALEASLAQARAAVSEAAAAAQAAGEELRRTRQAAGELGGALRASSSARACFAEAVVLRGAEAPEAEARATELQRNAEQVRRSKVALSQHVGDLALEERHHVAAAATLQRSLRAEAAARQEVEEEAQAASAHRDSLAADLTGHTRARTALLEQLRRLRPEIQGANDRCRHIEERYSRCSWELEEELAVQRLSHQEAYAAEADWRRLQDYVASRSPPHSCSPRSPRSPRSARSRPPAFAPLAAPTDAIDEVGRSCPPLRASPRSPHGCHSAGSRTNSADYAARALCACAPPHSWAGERQLGLSAPGVRACLPASEPSGPSYGGVAAAAQAPVLPESLPASPTGRGESARRHCLDRCGAPASGAARPPPRAAPSHALRCPAPAPRLGSSRS